MNRRMFACLGAVAILMAAPLASTAEAKNTGLSVPVKGTINGKAAAGTFDIERFGLVGNQIRAFGTVKLRQLEQQDTNAVNIIATSVPLELPSTKSIGAAAASCDILNLTLGPLDLNLLGLVVHLDQIVLDIRAEPGSGNLLGNLLCAVANLLNGLNLSTVLQQLVAALNNLLNAL